MPIIKSAIKKMRQDRKKTTRNKIQREKMNEAIKTVNQSVKDNKTDKLSDALKSAYKKIDKAVKKNLIHPNNSARKKSRLSRICKAAVKKSK